MRFIDTQNLTLEKSIDEQIVHFETRCRDILGTTSSTVDYPLEELTDLWSTLKKLLQLLYDRGVYLSVMAATPSCIDAKVIHPWTTTEDVMSSETGKAPASKGTKTAAANASSSSSSSSSPSSYVTIVKSIEEDCRKDTLELLNGNGGKGKNGKDKTAISQVSTVSEALETWLQGVVATMLGPTGTREGAWRKLYQQVSCTDLSILT